MILNKSLKNTASVCLTACLITFSNGCKNNPNDTSTNNTNGSAGISGDAVSMTTPLPDKIETNLTPGVPFPSASYSPVPNGTVPTPPPGEKQQGKERKP